jgi:GNAT superfamily N-acetyltransferase
MSAAESPSLRSSRSVSYSKIPVHDDLEVLYLRDNFNSELLERYYHELLVPYIPFEDERDPISKIEKGLKRPTEELRSDRENVLPYVNVCLILQHVEGVAKPILAGASQFEYYCTANCGLLNYLLVNEEVRGKGIAKILVKLAQDKLEEIAKFFGHLAGFFSFFSKFSFSNTYF